jgi:hypothetical protein
MALVGNRQRINPPPKHLETRWRGLKRGIWVVLIKKNLRRRFPDA